LSAAEKEIVKRKIEIPTSEIISIFASRLKNDLVAQPVEQLTLNQWVEGSIPSQVTKFQKPSLIVLEAVFVF
jgi:hypothetical protein